MKELIPGLGDRTTQQRLDELFSRETLGAVLFGAAVSKVVEKLNILVAALVIIMLIPIEMTPEMWVVGVILFIFWSMELVIFTYLYVMWEEAMKEIAQKAEQTKEKAKEVKDSTNSE